MDVKSVVDVRDFPRLIPSNKAPIWWGIVGLILIEATVVACFIAAYFYLQIMNAEWPPAGVEPPPLPLPTLSLVLLLASCYTMYLAGKLISKGKQGAFVAAIAASVALASAVLVLRWMQFGLFDFRWDEHAYGSIVWAITGFHFTHVVSAVIGTFVVGILGLMGFFTPARQIGVIVDTLYWYFVGLAWIPFYLVLYWAPRWM